MLSGILQSAISGVNASAQSVAVAADNIANVSTSGYKRSEISTRTLVTQQTTASYSAGGVQAVSRPLADVQGAVASSPTSTNLAISGNGYFAVSRQPEGGETFYTRDGSFAPDAQGNLVNTNGYFLQGREPGAPGGALGAVNVNAVSGSAQATSKISVSANLPAPGSTGAQAGDVYRVSANATDSLGNSHAVQLDFTAQAGGGYKLTIAGAQQDDASGAAYDVGVAFNGDALTSGFDVDGDGTPDSATPPGIYIPFASSGASALSLELDLSGLTQFSGEFTVGAVQSDGARYGQVSGVSVSSDGTLSATFDNGATQAVAEIPVATFASPQNLEAVSGNAFRATDGSGAATLDVAGLGGSGSVQGNAQELSTTDLGTEFVGLIVAQSAYSASLKVLQAGEELSRSLLNVRA